MKRHRHHHEKESTLDQVSTGKTVWVQSIRGGWGSSQRLNQMGIHTGDPVTVKRNAVLGGPVLVQIHGSEVALGRGMARHIIVTSHKTLNDTDGT